MKLLCIIDSLGSGGAQRQMVNLACGLKARNHNVELVIYHSQENFFRTEINNAGIAVHEVTRSGRFSPQVVLRLVQLYRVNRYDAVISFLDTANIYAEIAKVLSCSKVRLIVSERSSIARESNSIFSALKRWFHLPANFVVANSVHHASWLRKKWWLKNKTHCIYNGYPLGPVPPPLNTRTDTGELTLLAVGRISSEKNGLRLLQSVIHLHKKNGVSPTVWWVGRQEQDRSSLKMRETMQELLDRNPDVARRWQFLGERDDVFALLQRADALIHVSLYEGLPNVICEAFLAARPVIASGICDHPILVEEGSRGLLCDPLSVRSISNAIERFMNLTVEEREALGRGARIYAEKNLSLGRMIRDYENLLSSAR
jgi:glycosyltransferase involved in cell wall biosynthesis